jgi:hypothetical protein
MTSSIATSSPTVYESRSGRDVLLHVNVSSRSTEVVVSLEDEDSPPVSPSSVVHVRVGTDVQSYVDASAMMYEFITPSVVRAVCSIVLRPVGGEDLKREVRVYVDMPSGRLLADQLDRCILSATISTIAECRSLLVASFGRDAGGRLYFSPKRVARDGGHCTLTYEEVASLLHGSSSSMWRFAFQGILYVK